MSKTSGKNQSNFDQSIKKLEEIIEKMENGELPLEQSIKLFEEGIELSKKCQIALKAAEGKIEKLMKESNSLVEFKDVGKEGD
ncbi:MAG: exodeoxyribonuclease VII small subunit [Pseudomonadota bacterium]|nr:exodeoxyribonuclease VII small subunit [Pseudomonadota bacterium]